MIGTCGLGTHTLRCTCKDAHGRPAVALIDAPGGLSAERQATMMMATIAHEQFSTLERCRQLDAVGLLMIHLATDQGGKEAPPFEGLFDQAVLDLIGQDEWKELYEPNREPPAMERLRGDLLLAQLFSRLASASAYCADRADFFHKLATSRFDELAEDGRDAEGRS